MNTAVSLLGCWRHRTIQDVCLWLVFPTAAFSDSILLKANNFLSLCNYQHLVILTMLSVSAFTKLLLQLPFMLVSNVIKWRENYVFHTLIIEFNNYTQESLYSPVTSSTFPYCLLSERHPFTWSHDSKLLSLALFEHWIYWSVFILLFCPKWWEAYDLTWGQDNHYSLSGVPQSCGGYAALPWAIFSHHEIMKALTCDRIYLAWQAGCMLHSSLSHSTAVIHHAARVLPAVMNDWWDLLIPSSVLP